MEIFTKFSSFPPKIENVYRAPRVRTACEARFCNRKLSVRLSVIDVDISYSCTGFSYRPG